MSKRRHPHIETTFVRTDERAYLRSQIMLAQRIEVQLSHEYTAYDEPLWVPVSKLMAYKLLDDIGGKNYPVCQWNGDVLKLLPTSIRRSADKRWPV